MNCLSAGGCCSMKTRYQVAIDRLGAEKLARGELIRNDSKVEPYLLAIKELVDKETPKKPYYEGDGYADGVMVYDVARCPNCDNVFEKYENNGWGENYCHNCGQRLDWSDTE